MEQVVGPGGSPGGAAVRNPPASAGDGGSTHGLERSPEKEMASPPVYLPGKSRGQRGPAGYSSWGCKESDMAE